MRTEIVNIDEIHEAIIAFANGDFSKRLHVSDKKDERDSIVSGINMLGEELQQTTISKNYFSNIYNAVSDMLIVTDSNGIIKDVNETTINTIKLTKESLINLDAQTIEIEHHKEINTAIDSDIDNYSFFTSLTNSLNEKIPLSCSISKIKNKHNELEGYLIIAKDITEKKKQEQELLNVMIATEEKERTRLAYDLHDSLGQELNAIQMYLSTLNFNHPNDKEYKTIFEECKSMLNVSIETVRNLSYDLMPKSLEDGCLTCALEDLMGKLNSICTFNYDFQITTELKKEQQIIIYRVFQEFINNSLKHTSPCIVHIEIKEVVNKISFRIMDEGCGFDMEKCNKGNGIHNIKTRLKALDADYNYESKPNQGTTLEFNLSI